MKIASWTAVSAVMLTGAFAFGAASAAPRTAAQTVAENGAYFWVDGVYEQVKLPTYRLGYHNSGLVGATNLDFGPVQSVDPRAGGGGVRAAFGYALPGSSTRVEFGGSYVEARDVQSQGTMTSGSGAPLLLLTGAGYDTGLNCQAGLICSITGTLATNYRAWQFNAKIESDWRSGALTVTPSLTVFGGNSRNDQSLFQLARQVLNGVPLSPATPLLYTAATRLEWRDLGARAGLHLNAAVTPAMTVGVGGSVGVAAREVSFSGSDIQHFGILGGPPLTSALSLGDNKAVLLANAEAGFAINVAPGATVRGFAGLNHDGDVPGIGAPTWAGSIQAPTSRSAARIIYESQTSYYAGGGLTVAFGARP